MRAKLRNSISLIVCTTCLVLLVIASTNINSFKEVGQRLEKRVVPTPILDYGKLGDLLKQNRLVFEQQQEGIGSSSDRVVASQENASQPLNLFQKKRQNSQRVYAASPGGSAGLPSSRQSRMARSTIPQLFIAIEKQSLFDQQTGIVANPEKRGKQWEKPATLTIAQEANIKEAYNAEIRLHGSRLDRRVKSNRSYLAADYAYEVQFPNRLNPDQESNFEWFNEGSKSFNRLIIDNTSGAEKHLGFQIASAAGLEVPYSTLLPVHINTNYGGFRQIREPVDKEQWQLRKATDLIDFFSSRDEPDDEGWQWYTEMIIWYKQTRENIDLHTANRYIDLDLFSREVAVRMICGSNDWHRWAVYRNHEEDGRWRWITWDLESCISDRWETAKNGLASQEWMRVVASTSPKTGQLRVSYRTIQTLIFVNLMNRVPEYRSFFFKTLSTVLVELQQQDFKPLPTEALNEVVGLSEKEFDLNQFIADRASFIEEDLARAMDQLSKGDSF